MAELTLQATCNADTEEGAAVDFKIYREGADPKRDKPVAELRGFNEGGTAKVKWEPVDVREPGDRTELRYFFTVDTWRAETGQSPLILITNPQIIEMKWDPEFIYHGDKAKLRMTTFEVANASPAVKLSFWMRGEIKSDEPVFEQEKIDWNRFKLSFWEKGKPDPYRQICEQEVTIDKDEIEITFDSSYSADDSWADVVTGDYKVETFITCESHPLTVKCNLAYLTVGAGTGRD